MQCFCCFLLLFIVVVVVVVVFVVFVVVGRRRHEFIWDCTFVRLFGRCLFLLKGFNCYLNL